MNFITVHIENLRQPNYHLYVTKDKEYIINFVFPINGDKLHESWMNRFIESFGNMSLIKTDIYSKSHRLFKIKSSISLSMITAYIIQKMSENMWRIVSINGIDKDLHMIFEKTKTFIEYKNTCLNYKNLISNDFYEIKSNL